MHFSEYLSETRLIHREKVPIRHAQLIYDHAVKFIHDFLGVDVTSVHDKKLLAQAGLLPEHYDFSAEITGAYHIRRA